MVTHGGTVNLRGRRIRLGIVVFLLVVTGALSLAPVQRAVLNLAESMGGTYTTYRLLSERNALVLANQRLQEELAVLKTSGAEKGTFEDSVRAQLDELHGIIASATELTLDDEEPLTTAHEGHEGHKSAGELAAILNSPALNRPAHKGSRRSTSPTKPGVGGAEVECSTRGKTGCEEPHKQRISLVLPHPRGGKQRLGVKERTRTLTPSEDELMRKLAQVSTGLRVLPMGYPVEGELTSGFGFRRSPFSRRISFHQGLDISLGKGGTVVATGDGEVVRVEFNRAYGWYVDVQHSPVLLSRYAHLSKPTVKVGQEVTRGNRIGLSGSTGRSTGPHLHYEVRIKGRARNPQAFVLLPEKLARVF